jgi:hypothetical protein
MKTLEIKLNEKISLEELFKDRWVEAGNLGPDYLTLARSREKIIYDLAKREVIFKYQPEKDEATLCGADK